MVQADSMTADMAEKPNYKPNRNEANDGLKNLRGALAMARLGEPHSAASQITMRRIIEVKNLQG